MVEGFSAPPPNEVPDIPAAEAPLLPRRPGVKGILDTLRFNMAQSKERRSSKEEDDDDEKEGRFTRALRRVFGAIVGKDEIEERTDSSQELTTRGLFFDVEPPESSPLESNLNTPPLTAETPHPTEVPASRETETVAPETNDERPAEQLTDTEEGAETDVTAETPLEVPTEVIEDTDLGPEVVPLPTDKVEPAFADDHNEDESHFPTRAAVVYGLYEHHRVSRLKEREEHLEKEVKDLHKKVDKTTKKRDAPKSEEQRSPDTERIEVTPQPQVVYERPKPLAAVPELRQPAEVKRPEIKAPKPPERFMLKLHTEREPVPEKRSEKATEKVRTVGSETTPEQRRNAVEKAVDRHAKELSEERKQEIIEKILIAPEFNGVLNTEVQKDISYELSHEHKDKDRQSQAAWLAVQAAADATAKSNAQAIANAGSQIPTALSGDALKKAATQAAKDKKLMYNKAAVGGVISAIVLLAVYFVALLLLKK